MRSIILLVVAFFLTLTSSAVAVDVKVVTPKELWDLFIKKGIPQYPFEARRARTTGSGIYRMYIEPDGTVRTVGVMKSSGSQILDLAAAGGLYQWRAKPGKRREIDMPVTFTMTR